MKENIRKKDNLVWFYYAFFVVVVLAVVFVTIIMFLCLNEVLEINTQENLIHERVYDVVGVCSDYNSWCVFNNSLYRYEDGVYKCIGGC